MTENAENEEKKLYEVRIIEKSASDYCIVHLQKKNMEVLDSVSTIVLQVFPNTN